MLKFLKTKTNLRYIAYTYSIHNLQETLLFHVED
jgi:hypothetical protein